MNQNKFSVTVSLVGADKLVSQLETVKEKVLELETAIQGLNDIELSLQTKMGKD